MILTPLLLLPTSDALTLQVNPERRKLCLPQRSDMPNQQNNLHGKPMIRTHPQLMKYGAFSQEGYPRSQCEATLQSMLMHLSIFHNAQWQRKPLQCKQSLLPQLKPVRRKYVLEHSPKIQCTLQVSAIISTIPVAKKPQSIILMGVTESARFRLLVTSWQASKMATWFYTKA